MIFSIYLAAAVLIMLSAGDLRDVRHCALIIALALLATVVVQYRADGVFAYVVWSVIWCVAAVLTTRQIWCSVLLLASGLCYIPVYVMGLSVGVGETASFLIDAFGIAALLVLGGQIIGQRLGSGSVVRFLGVGRPWARPHR